MAERFVHELTALLTVAIGSSLASLCIFGGVYVELVTAAVGLYLLVRCAFWAIRVWERSVLNGN